MEYTADIIWRRLASFLIDIAIAITVTALTYLFADNPYLKDFDYQILCVIYYLFFSTVALLYTSSQTIGQIFANVRVVNLKTGNPSKVKAIVGNIFLSMLLLLIALDKTISLSTIILLIFPFVFYKLFPPHKYSRITLGDIIFNTEVIRVSRWI